MVKQYEFVIKKGKLGKYREEVKRLSHEYAKDELPIPAQSKYDGEVYQTTSKKLFTRLCDIGFCESMVDREIRIKNEITSDMVLQNEVSDLDDEFPFKGKKGGFLYNDFAEWLYNKSGHYFVRIRQTGELYYYKGGIYIPHGETYIEEIVQREVGDYVKVSTTHVNEIISYIKRRVLNEIDIIQIRSERLACKNGVIDLRTKELKPHSPDNYMFKMIPWNYEPDATCDEFDELINRLLPTEIDQYKFNIMLGYPLINSYIYNKIFFLQGKPGTGKSTVSNIIQQVYGSDNISNIGLHDLITVPFMRVGLLNTYANFSGDASDQSIKDAAILKTLSGESRLDINVKNIRLPIKLMNCSKLIIDTNNMPEFKLTDDAIFRRLIKITFDIVIEESEKTSNHIDKYLVKSEMEGLLRKAVDSAHNILTGDNPFKTTSIGESKEAYENSRKNIVDKFILNHIQIYPKDFDDSYEIQADVWKKFTRFCKAQNIDREQMPNVNGFYKSFLLKSGIEKPKPHWIKSMGKSVNCYHGIKVLR